jgi:MFS family permease
VCFLSQNLGAGLAFASFGPLLHANEEHFGVSRSAAAMGMSLIMLAIGLLSPVAGPLMQRLSPRICMSAGAAMSAAGYGLLAMTGTFQLALVAYVLIGCGVSLTAILGPLAVVSRWFERDRGKILSLVNLPLVLFGGPYLIAALLPTFGRSGVLLGLAGLMALLAPALMTLAEPNARVVEDDAGAAVTKSLPTLLTQPSFWLLSLGLGVVAGASSAFLVHVVAFGVGRDLALPEASALISAYAAAGIFGTLLFGWIADAIGPVRALVLSALAQAMLWSVLVVSPDPFLFLVAAALGVCAVPQNTLHGAAMSALFGPQAVKAMGLSFALKLPFLFGAAPLVGLLFEATGDYGVPFLACAGALVVATLLFLWLAFLDRTRGELSPMPSSRALIRPKRQA